MARRSASALGVALLLLLAPAGLAAQDDARLDAVVQPFVGDGRFMGAVLVARGDQPLLHKGYGWASLEWKIPNTPETKFRLGSITKQFTAALILLLDEEGKLAIRDPVSRHVPDAPAAWKDITLHHLLTHTSGIQNFTALTDYRVRQVQPSTPADQYARVRDLPLDFPPGSAYRYSNTGYLLLGYVIERLTGRPYAAVLQERVFAPLGMADSGYDSNTEIIERRAAGYAPSPAGPVTAAFVHMSVPHAAGALYSTTGDLLRWTRGLFGGKLLSAASLRRMTTPHLDDYALGIRVRDADGRRTISHGGGINGFSTFLAYYPDSQATVAVLGNLNGNAPQQIAVALGAAIHPR